MKNPIAERFDLDHVVDTAAEVFASHGFTGVGMRELSRRCKVSPPTLYYYFGSKEALFDQACRLKYQKAIDRTRRAVVLASAEDDAPLEQLCGDLFDLLTEDRTLFLLLRRDLIQSSVSGTFSRARPQYEALIELIAGTLVGKLAADAVQPLAFSIAALIFGYCELVHASRQPDTGKDEAVVRTQRSNLVAATLALLRGSL